MIPNNIKQQLDEFFTEYYNNLIEIATIFTKNEESAYDLVATLYSSLIKTKNITNLKGAMDNNNLFNYIFVALRFQARGYTTEYNKLKIKDRSDSVSTDEITSINPYEPSTEEKEWLILTKILFDLYKQNKIDHYEYTLHQLYYNYEELAPIDGLTLKQTNQLRNMSLRRLADKTKINYLTIHNTIKKVNNILKKEYDKRRDEFDEFF